jgi:hypothetical protein
MNNLQKLNLPTLFLPPSIAAWNGETDAYRSRAANIFKTLANVLPKPQVFLTDETAQALNPDGAAWIQPVPDEDALFIRTNCEGMGVNPAEVVTDAELNNKLRGLYPVPRGCSRERRFEVTLKRVSAGVKEWRRRFRQYAVFKSAAVSGIPAEAMVFGISRDLSTIEAVQSGIRLDIKTVLGEDLVI